jgi:hypothetical protein
MEKVEEHTVEIGEVRGDVWRKEEMEKRLEDQMCEEM